MHRNFVFFPASIFLAAIGGCGLVLGIDEYQKQSADEACKNGIRDGNETGADCGGGCGPCPDGLGCILGTDCESRVCDKGLCMAPTCSDGVSNGNETDIDCGGGTCPSCEDGGACTDSVDCMSGVCTSGICQGPTCSDSTKNGTETDTDCGGGCPACAPLAACITSSDCATNICKAQQCAALVEWAERFGDQWEQYGAEVRTHDVRPLIRGAFYGKLDFGTAMIDAGCTSVMPDPQNPFYCPADNFFIGLSSSGTHDFSRVIFNEEDGLLTTDLTVTSDGSSYVYAVAHGAIGKFFDLGGGAFPEVAGCVAPNCAEDIAIARYDSTGKYLWGKRFGGAGRQQSSDAIGFGGDVLVTGAFNTSINFGGAPQSSAGSTDMFIARIGSNGTQQWLKRYGDANEQYGEVVRVDAVGNVAVAGYFKGTMPFGVPNLTAAGGYDLFVAELNSTGTPKWARRFGDVQDQENILVEFDPAGNVIVAGPLVGTIDFGPGTLTGLGDKDIFVAKLDLSGVTQWANRFGPADAQSPGIALGGIAVDDAGNVLITGKLDGPVDFGGGALTGNKPFLVKLDPSGAHVWSTHAAGGSSITTVGLNKIYLTGSFTDTIDLGGIQLTSAGLSDVFVAALYNP